MVFWIILGVAVLGISSIIGMHLGRFREAYTEMTGMMAGMTMGMLNGFLLGFASAAAIGSADAGGSTGGYITAGMFWGNLFGILLGLGLGIYFGRLGGLMGIMDGAMGGVMGGSMGAMLSVMVRFPDWALLWTAILLVLLYIAGMVGLVVLIEQSAPGHEALHRLAPFFARAIGEEVSEGYDVAEEAERVARAAGKQPQYSRQGEQGGSKHSKQGRAGGQRRPQYQTRGQYPSYSRARYQQAQGPGPAVWGGIAAFAVIALVVAWTLGSNSETGTSAASGSSGNSSGKSTTGGGGQSDLAAQLDSQAVAAPVAADGKQTLDLVINGNTRGYKPGVIKVKQGVPVHFNLSVEGADPG